MPVRNIEDYLFPELPDAPLDELIPDMQQFVTEEEENDWLYAEIMGNADYRKTFEGAVIEEKKIAREQGNEVDQNLRLEIGATKQEMERNGLDFNSAIVSPE